MDWSGSIHGGQAGGFIGVEELLGFGQFYSVLVSSAAAAWGLLGYRRSLWVSVGFRLVTAGCRLSAVRRR